MTMSMYNDFKNFIQNYFGESFFEIKKINGADVPPTIGIDLNHLKPRGSGEGFFCRMMPIDPPMGSKYYLGVHKKGNLYLVDMYIYPPIDFYSGYFLVGSGTTYEEAIFETVSLDSTLKSLFTHKNLKPISPIFKSLLTLKNQLEKEDEIEDTVDLSSSPANITPDEWVNLNKLNGYYMLAREENLDLVKRIGKRYPKKNFSYLYRSFGGTLFSKEIENSFHTKCGEEEVILAKDLTDDAKKYLGLSIKGLRSWTYDKELALEYGSHGAKKTVILVIWKEPKDKDVLMDLDFILDDVKPHYQPKGPYFNYHKTTRYFVKSEVLVNASNNFRITGVKRWFSKGLCFYNVYVRSV